MTVANARSVDVVTHDKDDDEAVLIAVEDRPWDPSHERFAELASKIDHYVAVIRSGEVAATYPQLVGKRCRVQLDFVYSPGPELAGFLSSVAPSMSAAGVSLTVKVLPRSLEEASTG